MTRGFDALGFDPAPGELGRVDASAERYERVSDRLAFARDAISSIVDQAGIWEGEAGEAFVRRVDDLPEYLDAAMRSMSRAAVALADWHAELSELRRRAWELELQAREARDAELDVVFAAAERLRRQHDESARRVAGLLEKARDLAPDDLGLSGGCLEAAGDTFGTVGMEFAEARGDAERVVADVIDDSANVIANASDVLRDVGGLAVAMRPGSGVGSLAIQEEIAVALENAIADGIDEDSATRAERDRERVEERGWE